jgi:RNA polymerase sigma factor (sigma-70 family)
MDTDQATMDDGPQSSAYGGLKAALLEHRPRLLRFLGARRVPPEEAEDLLQDLFVKIDGLHTGPIAEPRAYLYRMLDNLVLDRRRASLRRKGREEAWMAVQPGVESGCDESPSAEVSVLARQKLARVWAALNLLPERTVDVFRRYRIDDCPQKQIASELGISVSAVEKHLQRAYRVVAEVQQQLDADSPTAWRP